MERSVVGYKAELVVAQYLLEKGYAILHRNWRKKWGEIDIVAKKDGILVFIEVKANTSNRAGFDPLVRANQDKIRKVARTAQTYLATYEYPAEQDWQIDVVALTFDVPQGTAKVQHFKNIELT